MENENNIQQDTLTTINKKKNSRKRQRRKLAWLFTLTGITAVVLIVETYAWFIGTGSIQTSEFQIGVSTEKSLFLSLDGERWSENLTISKENILGLLGDGTSQTDDNHNAYTNHTNKWVDDEVGLIPISTSGEKDLAVSRLKLFGKSSITATPGGFRLISTRLDNYSKEKGEDGEETGYYVDEREGYVAFDLFIKNGEGVDYIEKYNEEDDEAIYLTTNSAVTVVKSGDVTEDYGLANSVRVAFAQIGRVASATATQEQITGMVCSPTNTGTGEGDETYPIKGEQTGLCKETKTTIWEPNDKSHDAKLIEYFNRVCKGREVERDEETKKVTASTYGVNEETKCMELKNGEQAPTYVVNQDIVSSDFVDVYDGLNGYDMSDVEEYKISQYETFTDSDKILTDEERPAFFKLAANSVTKIRVYIYLEGQDVDNYDLISLGKTIKINFGFTKDQFDLSNPKTPEPSEPNTEA